MIYGLSVRFNNILVYKKQKRFNLFLSCLNYPSLVVIKQSLAILFDVK